MNAKEALNFVKEHGIVTESARASVPSLAQAIVGGPISGSWWAHPRSREIYRLINVVRDSSDVLVCRLVDGKVTYVHRRLWPHLARLADSFPPKRICAILEIHTESGKHKVEETPFADWLSQEVISQANNIREEEALAEIGQFLPSAA
jgi:hypothetical protein